MANAGEKTIRLYLFIKGYATPTALKASVVMSLNKHIIVDWFIFRHEWQVKSATVKHIDINGMWYTAADITLKNDKTNDELINKGIEEVKKSLERGGYPCVLCDRSYKYGSFAGFISKAKSLVASSGASSSGSSSHHKVNLRHFHFFALVDVPEWKSEWTERIKHAIRAHPPGFLFWQTGEWTIEDFKVHKHSGYVGIEIHATVTNGGEEHIRVAANEVKRELKKISTYFVSSYTDKTYSSFYKKNYRQFESKIKSKPTGVKDHGRIHFYALVKGRHTKHNLEVGISLTLQHHNMSIWSGEKLLVRYHTFYGSTYTGVEGIFVSAIPTQDEYEWAYQKLRNYFGKLGELVLFGDSREYSSYSQFFNAAKTKIPKPQPKPKPPAPKPPTPKPQPKPKPPTHVIQPTPQPTPKPEPAIVASPSKPPAHTATIQTPPQFSQTQFTQPQYSVQPELTMQGNQPQYYPTSYSPVQQPFTPSVRGWSSGTWLMVAGLGAVLLIILLKK